MKEQKNFAYTAILKGDGWSLGLARRDEPGYFDLGYEIVRTEAEARRWADTVNGRMGITREEESDIVTSSMRAQNIQGRRAGIRERAL